MSGVPTGKLLYGHTDVVAFSPNGTSGPDDETIRIWDVMSGAPISEGTLVGINLVAFSPDCIRLS